MVCFSGANVVEIFDESVKNRTENNTKYIINIKLFDDSAEAKLQHFFLYQRVGAIVLYHC